MSDNPNANITPTDILTLLILNQHALAVAIEELALWAKTHENAVTALRTLDASASAITAGTLKLRQ